MTATYAGHTAEALRALCAGATPGPWVSFADEPGALYTVASVGGGPDAAIEEVCREPEGDERAADMAFIAAANPATVLTLLDRVAALEAECARLRAELTDLRDFCDSPHWSHGFESDGVSKWVTCDGRAMVRAMVEDALGE